MDRRIERLQRQCVAGRGVLSLAGGLPAPGTFPVAALARALRGTPREALQYDWPEGREPLRRWIAERLGARGADVRADDVLLTSGAQQALDIAVRITRPAGRRFRVPALCYPGALELFGDHRCELVGAGEAADLEYTMPAIDNPTGGSLAPAARAALLAGAQLVIEDDAYAELGFAGPAPAPLLAEARERVLHVGTLSKTLCPGLRVGWLVTPPFLAERARRAKLHTDLQGNTLAQSVVERYLAENDYERRLGSLRAYYARNAEALMRALRRHLTECRFEPPRGGFSLWLTAPEDWDDIELLRVALAQGTSFDPGRAFRRDGARSPLGMRLAFSAIAARDIDEAVRRLARAFHEMSRRVARSA